MKKVYPNAEAVFHVFAQKQQSEARSSNVFFERGEGNSPNKEFTSKVDYGTKIYSYGYHYLLAYFIDENTVYINDDGYSVTTRKHISYISSATRQYTQFYKSQTDLIRVHDACVQFVDKLATARKPEKYINEILTLFENLNTYLKFKKTLTSTKKDKRYKYISRIVRDINKDSEKLKEKLSEAIKEKAKKRRLANEKSLKIALKDFNEYKTNSFRVGEEDYVRISADGEHIETSQRIKIKKEDAKVLYKMIKAKKDIKGHLIGIYKVTSINGTLKIGCHNINIKNMHEIGMQII